MGPLSSSLLPTAAHHGISPPSTNVEGQSLGMDREVVARFVLNSFLQCPCLKNVYRTCPITDALKGVNPNPTIDLDGRWT